MDFPSYTKHYNPYVDWGTALDNILSPYSSQVNASTLGAWAKIMKGIAANITNFLMGLPLHSSTVIV